MKRKIAAALAIVMIGATYATPFVQAADGSTTESEAVTVNGSAGLAYVDTSKIQVVVPTSKALDFTIDPQGLVALAEQTDNEASADELKAYSGRILGNTALIFANKSIKDVKVTTKFTVTDGAGALVADGDTIKDKANSNKLNLQFLAVPTKTAIELEYGDGEGKSGSTSLASIDEFKVKDFAGATNGVKLGTTATDVETVLPAADYKFTGTDGNYDYELDTTNKNKAAGFVISGFCNPYANYDSKTFDASKVSVSASYTFDIASDSESTTANSKTDGYGVITTLDTAAPADGNLVSSVSTSTNKNVLTSDGTKDIVIYNSAIKTSDTIVITGLTNTGSKTAINRTVAANAECISITDATSLTIKGSWISTLKTSRGTGTYSVKIGNSTDTYTITIS
jgi:hypothetical protein